MNNKLEDQVLIIKASQEKLTSYITDMKYGINKRDSDMMKIDHDMKNIKKMFTQMVNHKHKSQAENKDSPKFQDPTTVVPANKKAPPLEGGHSTKIGGMCTLKHDIISPKFYELLSKT